MPDPLTLVAIGSLLSNLATNATNYFLSERNNKRNEENQAQQNDYNLPVNQVQRLKDAGINPNALTMSSGMSVQGNTSAGINPYTTPQMVDPMSMISNNLLTTSQAKTEDALRQVRVAEAQAHVEELKASANKLGLEGQYQGIINTFAAARQKAALLGERFDNHLKLYQTRVVKLEAKKLSKFIEEQMPEEIAKIIAEKDVFVGQLDVLAASVADLEASAGLKEAQTDVAVESAAKIEMETAKTAYEAEHQQMENVKYEDLMKLIFDQYGATIREISAKADISEQEAFYYLYELGMKHDIRILGLPIMGAGGIKSYGNNRNLQEAMDKKYNNTPWNGHSYYE